MTDLTHAQATELAAEINALLASAYDRLLAFYEGRGWLALGYASFADCAYPVFRVHHAMLYRRLNAAQHTDALGVPVLPEHAGVLNAVDADKRGKVIEVATQLARARGKDSFAASDLQRAANHVAQRRSLYQEFIERGELTTVQAIDAETALHTLNGTYAVPMAMLAQSWNLHDVGAILALAKHTEGATFREVAVTGCLEIENGVQVPLSQATQALVEQAWDVAQRKHITANRDYTNIEYVGLDTRNPKAAAAALRKAFGDDYVKQLAKELGNG